MNGEIGRIDGSLGLAIQHPCVSIEFAPHEQTMVRGGTSNDRVLFLAEIETCSTILGVEPNIEIAIREVIPAHQGLGSGTQTRLAILSALSHRFGMNHSPSELGALSARGGTSGIGINAFRLGGLLLDGGHSVGLQKESFAPSHFATKAGQPPLLMRTDFPSKWGIALFVPDSHQGLSGQDELDFMVANTPIPLAEVQSTAHLILMRLLPSLRELDLATFGSCVSALQDVGWKKRHWSRADIKPLECVRSAFDAAPEIQGSGLSSTGSTIFGFFDTTAFSNEQISAILQTELRKQNAISGEVVCTRANNSGLRLESLLRDEHERA